MTMATTNWQQQYNNDNLTMTTWQQQLDDNNYDNDGDNDWNNNVHNDEEMIQNQFKDRNLDFSDIK